MLYEYHNTICEILNEYLKNNYQNGYRKETIDKATYNIFEYIEGAFVSSENYRIPMTMITGSIEFSPSYDELLSLDFKLFIIGNKIMYMYEDIWYKKFLIIKWSWNDMIVFYTVLIISLIANVIMLFLLYRAYQRHICDNAEKQMFLLMIKRERSSRFIEKDSPEMYIFNADKYSDDYPLYEVILNVKADEEFKESAKLSINKVDKLQVDLSSKYIVTLTNNSDCTAQIHSLLYERYGEISFLPNKEISLVNNNGISLVFDIKDKPQSMIVTFKDNQLIYNIEQAKGNVIYPKLDFDFLK